MYHHIMWHYFFLAFVHSDIFSFCSGKGGSSQNQYHVDLEFLKDIIPEVRFSVAL